MSEGLGTILTILSWLAVSIALVTGVVAAYRLRRSGAGLVIGGSLALMAFTSVILRLYRVLLLGNHLEESDLPRFFLLRLLGEAIQVASLLALIVALFVYPATLARSGR